MSNQIVPLGGVYNRPSGPMRQIIETLGRREGRPQRWMPNRLILQEFWAFHYQEYHFVDGRLNLKGANQSGKTVTMAAALPFLLDGIARPERFDPDGSRARGIDYFLLGGGDEGPQFEYQDRTAYLALEYVHGATGEYFTTGIGLRASKSVSNRQFRGFVIRDGRRLGPDHEIQLQRESDGTPLSWDELDRIVGEHADNVVVRQQEDYMREVNQALFGFSDLEQYKLLISILLQLRSPRLNKSESINEVKKALTVALPALDEAALDHASDAVSKLDRARSDLDRTRAEVQSARELNEVYGALLNLFAQRTAFHVRKAHRTAEKAAHEEGDAQKQVAQAERLLAHTLEELAEREAEFDRILAALDQLRRSEAFLGVAELHRMEQALEEKTGALKQSRDSMARAEAALKRAESRPERLRDEWRGEIGDLLAATHEAGRISEEAVWPLAQDATRQLVEELQQAKLESDEDPARALTHEVLREDGRHRIRKVDALIAGMDAQVKAERSYESTQVEVDRARQERAKSDAQRLQAVRDVESSAAATADALIGVRHNCGVLSEERAAFEQSAEELRAVELPEDDVMAALAPIWSAADRHAAHLEDEDAKARDREHIQGREVERIQKELNEARAKTWATPAPRRGQAEARERLAAAGIPAVPLYEACDYQESVDPAQAAAFESALEDAGLLDALILRREHAPRVGQILDGAQSDRWLVASQPAHGPSLADFLRPDTSAIEGAEVWALLRSIAVGASANGGHTSITSQGGWRLGIAEGRALRETDTPRFIGETNRRREKERLIRRLEEELGTARRTWEEARQEKARVQSLRESLKIDRRKITELAELKDLKQAQNRLSVAQQLLARSAARSEAADQALGRAHAALQEARKAVRVLQAEVPGSEGRSMDGVRKLKEDTTRVLVEVRGIAERASRLKGVKARYREALADVQEEQERAELQRVLTAEAEREVRRIEEGCNALRQRLASEDAREVVEQVRQLESREKELGQRVGDLRQQVGKSQGRLEERRIKLESQARITLDRATQLEAIAHRLRRQLEVEPHPTLQRSRDLLGSGVEGVVIAAEDLLRLRSGEESDLHDRIERNVREAEKRFYETVSQAKAELRDHHPEVREEEADGMVVPRLRLRWERLPVPPMVAVENLEARLHEYEQVLKEEEAQFITEFVMKDLALRFRESIRTCRELVKTSNALLEERPISSANGERVSLKWEPKNGRSEDEESAGLSKLVQLLGEADVAVLPDEHAEWVGNFLRRRIENIGRQDEAGMLEVDYREALRQALDYRDWFEFRVFTQIPARRATEVTQEGIGRRSGAGKSLALFLPLVVAAQAIYRSARPDAPQLIGLDEAFERVDPANIDTMFGVLVSMDFSWIMTSATLWGRGSTLPACATYEQITVGNVVTPILHVWNGTEQIASLDWMDMTTEQDGQELLTLS
jgi:uncharacterized protein (TIGR02680 family)